MHKNLVVKVHWSMEINVCALSIQSMTRVLTIVPASHEFDGLLRSAAEESQDRKSYCTGVMDTHNLKTNYLYGSYFVKCSACRKVFKRTYRC
jgi:hypothetical protein